MLFLMQVEVNSRDKNYLVQELYQQNHELLLHYAYSLLKNKQQAEDAVHEAFVRIIKNPNKVIEILSNNCSKARGYLVITTRNVCLTMLLHRKHEYHEDLGSVAERVSATESLDPTWDEFEGIEAKDILLGLIQDLPDIERDILFAVIVDMKSYKEVAKQYGFTVKNVSVKLARIRARLMKAYLQRRQVNELELQ